MPERPNTAAEFVDQLPRDAPMRALSALDKRAIDLDLDQIEELLENQIHKVRVGAVSVMDF